jgi:hypothetical protein
MQDSGGRGMNSNAFLPYLSVRHWKHPVKFDISQHSESLPCTAFCY